MTNPLENMQQLIINEFSKTIEMFDVSPSEARLFSILYIEDSPMTLDDMSETLGKSKTAVSTGIRNLLELNLVERVWKKGVRKDLYTTDSNLYRKFMSTYIHKWIDHTSSQEQSLDDVEKILVEEYKSDNLPTNDTLQLEKKLAEIISFNDRIKRTFQAIKPDPRRI